jgi:hypothetical protein
MDHRNATATAATFSSRKCAAALRTSISGQGRYDRARMIDSFVNAQAQIALDKLNRMRQTNVETFGLEAVTQVDDVAKAACAEQADARATMLACRYESSRCHFAAGKIFSRQPPRLFARQSVGLPLRL